MSAQFHARVFVTLKESVLDPQGQAVEQTLRSLGHPDVNGVRIGKLVELNLTAPDEGAARSQVETYCTELLVNPVIESYTFELAATAGDPA